MIKAAGNTELCEPLDVEPKAQCKVCLSYWDVGIVYCTCGHFLPDDIARGHSTKRTGGIFHRPCMRRTTTHHDAAQLSTTRVGALRPMPCCLGIGRPLTLGVGNARLEGAAGPPRGTGDALAGLGAGARAQRSSAAVPDAVLEVYLEHLLIMKRDELSVNSPVSRLYTTLPPENQER